MGTHPNGPSDAVLPAEGGEVAVVPLGELLDAHPDLVAGGTATAGDLPFLLKVLSVGRALSIQAHPDRHLARELHRTQPHLYRDPHHKPEMAVALTPFEVLVGFRPLRDTAYFLAAVPELAAVVGGDRVVTPFLAAVLEPDDPTREQHPEALHALFRALLVADPTLVQEQLDAFVERTRHLAPLAVVEERAEERAERAAHPDHDHERVATVYALAHRLAEEYPGDVGCFMVFLLNHVRLAPGEAVFLGANVPHAYLSGGKGWLTHRHSLTRSQHRRGGVHGRQ